MKILINTSNQYFGGGVQVALSFISELKSIKNKHKYLILVSPIIHKQIKVTHSNPNINFVLIPKSAASLTSRYKIVQKLKSIEKEFQPDIVFSLFGPVYWRPITVHLMGFALPWLIYPNSPAYSTLPFIKRLIYKLGNLYRKHYLLRDGDYYTVETSEVKNRLSKILSVNMEKIKVIGNTYSAIYNLPEYEQYNLPTKKSFRLVTISHNYSHKNLKIIAEVIPILIKTFTDFEFIVTITPDSYKDIFSEVSKYVKNLGPVEVKYCPSIYKQSDVLFLPTLLECFSASYPEAMKMQLPILTSNYPFAKEICKDAALYFNPLNPEDIANTILKIYKEKKLRIKLIENGKKVLSSFETSSSRALKYIESCEQITKTIHYEEV